MLNNEWLDQFDFPRPQENFKVGVNHVHAIHPVLDEFLFTEAGNISVASVGLLSGGTVLLVAVGCLTLFSTASWPTYSAQGGGYIYPP